MKLNNEEANILKILDDAAEASVFPMINNVHFTSAAIQLKVFTSLEEWLIIFDQVCYSEKHSFTHNITFFGNKITNHVNTCGIPIFNEHRQPRIVQEREDGYDWVDVPYIHFGLDEDIIVIQPSEEVLASAGVDEDAAGLTPGKILRLINDCNSEILFLNDQQLLELAGRSNNELTLFLQPEDWQHPDIADDERPGSIPCFISLAKAIATGDERFFQCAEEHFNTHWSNWDDLKKM